MACWSQIGVFGDRSCPELRNYTHCHNCPTHAAAGVQLLNRVLPPGYRRERTEHFARQRDHSDTGTFSAILFRIQGEWLAMPTRIFQEATEPRTIHSVPHRRGKILGLANVRGELVICVSIGHLLGTRTDQPVPPIPAAYHRLLVLEHGGTRLAFPVDEVQGPYRFAFDELHHLPAKARGTRLPHSRGILRWQDRPVGLLDPDVLLSAFKRNFR